MHEDSIFFFTSEQKQLSILCHIIWEYQNFSNSRHTLSLLRTTTKKRLAALNGSEFSDTVNYMLEHVCKLQQEALYMA